MLEGVMFALVAGGRTVPPAIYRYYLQTHHWSVISSWFDQMCSGSSTDELAESMIHTIDPLINVPLTVTFMDFGDCAVMFTVQRSC